MKLVKTVTNKGRVTYINPDKISVIDQSPVEPDVICMVVDNATIWITAAEFARILPLLTDDTPAPVQALALPSNVIESWGTFDRLSFDEMGNENKSDEWGHARDMFLTYFGDFMEKQS